MEDGIRSVEELGEALRASRHAQRFTQNDLAQWIGMRQATVSSLESGAGGTLSSLFSILSALNLEVVLRPATASPSADDEKIF
jgi:HTH-type transcriptional regulator/antitoxin HipB